MPAGCRLDPLLAKAEPISDGGSISGITYLSRKKKLQRERGARMCERSSSADPKVSTEGGQEVLPAPEQRFPAARGADRGEAGCPCSHAGP